MITKISTQKELHGSKIIWRYVGFDKFVDMLISKQLYFQNAGQMTDQYEGTLPQKTIESKRRNIISVAGYSEEIANQHIDTIKDKWFMYRNHTLLNCWSMNTSESYALWKIYLGGSKAGVAIKSTISSLNRAIEYSSTANRFDIYLGQVDYDDYIPVPELTRERLILTKNKFYKFENEVRLFILNDAPSPGVSPQQSFSPGVRVSVNILELIKKLYISPFNGIWFHKTIKRLIQRLAPELNNRIISSQIMDQ